MYINSHFVWFRSFWHRHDSQAHSTVVA
jgi:hypothetical protein